MKRVLSITLILAVVIGLSVAGYWYATPAAEPADISEDPNVELVPVALETMVDTVSATGSIEPKAEVDMKFEIGGTVEEVLVKRGQYVSAGTVLARLDTDDLELEVEKADIDLAKQEAELEKLLEPELEEKITSARSKIESARLELAELVDGPDEDEATKAASTLKQKEVELKKAQWDYDQVAYRGDVGARPEADALQQATLEYESAVAEYNLAVKEATDAEIAKARSTLAAEEAGLAELLEGPSPADIASKQADVDKTRLALQEARNNLKEAVLIAPTDGVILSVDIEPGERVLNEADNAALVIGNTSAYQLKVEVDEIDIGRVAEGQDTMVTVDAYPEQEFDGRVVDISPSPVESDTSGIVTYEVIISIDTTSAEADLLPGMTATAAVETKRLDNVMVIPNRAVQIERENAPAIVYVEKLDDGGDLMRVEVALGLRDSEVTQVLAGLEEGDQVVIRKQPPVGPNPEL